MLENQMQKLRRILLSWGSAGEPSENPDWTDEFLVVGRGHHFERHEWHSHYGYSPSTLSVLYNFAELTDADLWAARFFSHTKTPDREAVLDRENAVLRQQVAALLERFGSKPQATTGHLDNAREAVRLAVHKVFGPDVFYRLEVTLNPDTDLPSSHQIEVAVRVPESVSVDDLADKHGTFYERVGQHLKPEASQRVRIALTYERS